MFTVYVNANVMTTFVIFLFGVGIRPEEIKKERDQSLRNLHLKGAYSAQELFDQHRGKERKLDAVSQEGPRN